MPLPKRLQQDLKKLSPCDLKALQALLDQLIRQASQASLDVHRAAKRHGVRSRRSLVKRSSRHYTYRQEYVKCGKQGCSCAKGKGHGPYWYAYWREGKKLKKKYLGTTKPGGD